MSSEAEQLWGSALRSVGTTGEYNEVVDALARDHESITEEALTAIRAEFPDSYCRVPDDSLRAAMARNLGTALSLVRTGAQAPTESDIADVADAVFERGNAGVPMPDALRAYRLCIGLIQSAFLRHAYEMALEPGLAVVGAQRLWSLSDAVSDLVTQRSSDSGVEDLLLETHLRSDFLARMISGRIDAADLPRLADSFGLDLEQRYLAFCGRPQRLSSLEALRRSIDNDFSRRGIAGVVGVVGGDCVGIGNATPNSVPYALLGLGPLVPLQQIDASFDVASRIVSREARRNQTGVVTLLDVSWELAVGRERLIARHLKERYLDCLASAGPMETPIRESLAAYLAHDGDVTAASKELHVHPNTLRYRLQRYADLGGVDLTSFRTVTELQWVFEALNIQA